MDKVIKAVEKVGFPIVISLLLCYILFVSLANNTTALNNLVQYLDQHHVTLIDK